MILLLGVEANLQHIVVLGQPSVLVAERRLLSVAGGQLLPEQLALLLLHPQVLLSVFDSPLELRHLLFKGSPPLRILL